VLESAVCVELALCGMRGSDVAGVGVLDSRESSLGLQRRNLKGFDHSPGLEKARLNHSLSLATIKPRLHL